MIIMSVENNYTVLLSLTTMSMDINASTYGHFSDGSIASSIEGTRFEFTTNIIAVTLNVAKNASCTQNSSGACVDYYHIPKYNLPVMIVICLVLSVLILSTVIGNVFVIAAIILERSLQGVSNYLILSLAVTDLLVAVCVMPLSLVNEVSVHWYLGNGLCDFWISVDVLCCTASILHLVAISLDRFWGVSNIDYIRRRSAKQILKMVLVAWFVAVAISIPPLFGWKEEKNNPELHGRCTISQNLVYTVFSTVGAFYCPVVLMIFLNFKIFIAARSRIRNKSFTGSKSKPTVNAVTNADTKTVHRTPSCSDDDGYTMCNGSMAVTMAFNDEMQMLDSQTEDGPVKTESENITTLGVQTINSHGKLSNEHINNITDGHVTCNTHLIELPGSPDVHSSATRPNDNNNHRYDLLKLKKVRREADRKRKDKLEMKRERKAAKVLGIITGAFVACWLPFFVLAVLVPFCGALCTIPEPVFSFCLWFGYFNSTLNPILYTIFNPSFRKAFHKIIYGKYRCRG